MHGDLYMPHQILAVCGRSVVAMNPLLTEDSVLLLNDKSEKKESMRLQLYKHF